MSTTVTIGLNCGSTDSEYVESGGDWIDMTVSSDYLVFSAGSDVVVDGASIPTQGELAQAGVILTGVEQTVSKYFLADISYDLLREIPLMGNTVGRYVMAFSFDGATASEPVLEIWDDENLNTVAGTTLGAGTPSSSWWRAITTTAAAPSSNWTGTTLSGATSSYYLTLNNGSGALPAADVLYCNLKIVIPSTAVAGLSATPKLAVKFTSN